MNVRYSRGTPMLARLALEPFLDRIEQYIREYGPVLGLDVRAIKLTVAATDRRGRDASFGVDADIDTADQPDTADRTARTG